MIMRKKFRQGNKKTKQPQNAMAVFESGISYAPVPSVQNPSRGWYSIFPFRLPNRPDFTELGYCLSPQENLVLVRICIGDYLSRPLDDEAIRLADHIFAFFAGRRREMIVRIVYDEEGNGYMHEPFTIEQIKTHMRQLGPVIKKYANHILTLQGNFTGSWGEMHHSRYLDDEAVAQLFLCLYKATSGSCRMAVRKPSQRRAVRQTLERQGEHDVHRIMSLLGIYNDGMLASDTDYGTYSSTPCTEYAKEWDREAELAYQDKHCRYVLNGGEVVCDNSCNDARMAVESFRKTHVSYLNSQYDKAVLDKWKGQTLSSGQGEQNAYDYISRHLGYCIRLQAAGINEQDPHIFQISLKNTGFASLYMETDLWITLTKADEDGEESGELLECSTAYRMRSETQPSRIMPGETVHFIFRLEPGAIEPGSYRVTCRLVRLLDRCTITLDNDPYAGILAISSLE